MCQAPNALLASIQLLPRQANLESNERCHKALLQEVDSQHHRQCIRLPTGTAHLRVLRLDQR